MEGPFVVEASYTYMSSSEGECSDCFRSLCDGRTLNTSSSEGIFTSSSEESTNSAELRARDEKEGLADNELSSQPTQQSLRSSILPEVLALCAEAKGHRAHLDSEDPNPLAEYPRLELRSFQLKNPSTSEATSARQAGRGAVGGWLLEALALDPTLGLESETVKRGPPERFAVEDNAKRYKSGQPTPPQSADDQAALQVGGVADERGGGPPYLNAKEVLELFRRDGERRENEGRMRQGTQTFPESWDAERSMGSGQRRVR